MNMGLYFLKWGSWTCWRTQLRFTCPMHSKANLPTPSCSEGEYRIYCRATSKENRKLELKRSKLLDNFQERAFKGNIRGESHRVCDQLDILIGWW